MESILKYQQLFIVFSCILVHSAHAFDVKGTIKFKGEKPATLSAGSWLVVKMQDVSKMDAPAETLSTFEEEIKDYPAKPLAYQMSYNNVNVNKDQTITVSAVINVGWKANGDNWLRPGDYLTDTHEVLDASTNDNSYEKDVTVKYYE